MPHIKLGHVFRRRLSCLDVRSTHTSESGTDLSITTENHTSYVISKRFAHWGLPPFSSQTSMFFEYRQQTLSYPPHKLVTFLLQNVPLLALHKTNFNQYSKLPLHSHNISFQILLISLLTIPNTKENIDITFYSSALSISLSYFLPYFKYVLHGKFQTSYHALSPLVNF